MILYWKDHAGVSGILGVLDLDCLAVWPSIIDVQNEGKSPSPLAPLLVRPVVRTVGTLPFTALDLKGAPYRNVAFELKMLKTSLGHNIERPDNEVLSRARGRFPRGFTQNHQLLLDICLGMTRPDPGKLRGLNRVLEKEDLVLLQEMVKVEFLASLEKNRAGTEEASGKEEPHPYDVFLMETSLSRLDMGLAVCMPRKPDSLIWYNGLTETWNMDPPTHKWRIASLSGPARILEALSKRPEDHPLMHAAMKRELLVDAELDTTGLVGETEEMHLNESQRRAVATVISPKFQKGFFCIQGPPG